MLCTHAGLPVGSLCHTLPPAQDCGGSQTIHTLPVGSHILPFLKPQGGHRPHFKHDLSLSQDGTNENLEDGNIPNRGEGRKAAWRRHPNRAWEDGNSVLGKGHKAEEKV